MNSTIQQLGSKFIGKLMKVFGWIGLLLSGLIFVSTPFLLHRANASLPPRLESLSESLNTASQSLAAQELTLDQLDGLLLKSAAMSGEIEKSLTDVTPLLDDMATFLGDRMTVTLNSTESSLRSASEGAAAIDSLLRLLSRIPFLGNIDYDPSQSLDASLVQAADGLAPLGPPLAELQRDLNTFSTSLKGVRIGIRGTESRFTALRGNVVGIKKVLASSSDRLGELAEAVDQLNEHLRGIVVGVGIFLGWSAIWFALVNAALIQQGEKTAGISE